MGIASRDNDIICSPSRIERSLLGEGEMTSGVAVSRSFAEAKTRRGPCNSGTWTTLADATLPGHSCCSVVLLTLDDYYAVITAQMQFVPRYESKGHELPDT